MKDFTEVSKDVFERIIEKNPTFYRSGTSTVCDPPIAHWHDDTINTDAVKGTWEYFQDRQVAKIYLDYLSPEGKFEDYKGQYYTYYVKTKYFEEDLTSMFSNFAK